MNGYQLSIKSINSIGSLRNSVSLQSAIEYRILLTRQTAEPCIRLLCLTKAIWSIESEYIVLCFQPRQFFFFLRLPCNEHKKKTTYQLELAEEHPREVSKEPQGKREAKSLTPFYLGLWSLLCDVIWLSDDFIFSLRNFTQNVMLCFLKGKSRYCIWHDRKNLIKLLNQWASISNTI